jgi:hypothetical protein
MWERRRADSLHAAQRFDAMAHARGMLQVYRDMLPGRIPELELEPAGRSEDRPLQEPTLQPVRAR